ncbi:helix-turn-helix domain-containing protein [Serratia fonticola]|jgi:transcriptional regulator with XRE-family HTH domain|uniref:helix-turn-helix domain-containing protein n=1 Tax=Serratia fonticola TaxID=47917 RepID=UPI00217A3EE6|nr:helix-turn-helix domain-containing protein [Serratia fonticola]CAI2006445.1 transcriptional repressor DicA [Serratia fonticola]
MVMTNKDPIIARMIERRALLGWSQNDLAREANVAPAQISRYENGIRRPTPKVLARIAEALAVPYEWLAEGDTKNFQNTLNEEGEIPMSYELPDEIVNYIKAEAKKLGVSDTEMATSLLKIGFEFYKLHQKS